MPSCSVYVFLSVFLSIIMSFRLFNRRDCIFLRCFLAITKYTPNNRPGRRHTFVVSFNILTASSLLLTLTSLRFPSVLSKLSFLYILNFCVLQNLCSMGNQHMHIFVLFLERVFFHIFLVAFFHFSYEEGLARMRGWVRKVHFIHLRFLAKRNWIACVRKCINFCFGQLRPFFFFLYFLPDMFVGLRFSVDF